MDKVTAEVKEGRSERIKGWRRGNILDGSIVMPRPPQSILQERWTARAESKRLRGTVAKVLSLAFTMKRRKDTPSSSGAVFLFPSHRSSRPTGSTMLVSFPLRCTPLDSVVVEVHFIPTFNKVSRPLRGFIKNWGCNSPRGRTGGAV